MPEVGRPEVLGVPLVEPPPEVLGSPEDGNPLVGRPEVGNPEVGNPLLGRPELGKPEVGNPLVGMPEVGTPLLGIDGPTCLQASLPIRFLNIPFLYTSLSIKQKVFGSASPSDNSLEATLGFPSRAW